MASVGIRELRSALTAYVRRAQAGERVIVTIDGTPVAQLSTAGSDTGRITIDDLVARGAVIAPRRSGGFVPSEPLILAPGVRIDRALSEVRK